jgi:hypothetical protein
MTGAERVLNTPLPLAYSILISQITWIYVLVLPFQLFDQLGWLTIPGAMGRSCSPSGRFSNVTLGLGRSFLY